VAKHPGNFANKVFLFFIIVLLYIPHCYSQGDWLETESEHFKVIYRPAHAQLVPKIVNAAENSLRQLMEIFNYTPSEKIVINTYDASDFGFGAATSVPQNYIRFEIEPFENGYETVPYNDRIQWVLSHELVHIVVNDQASDVESFFRSIFSKVAPEQSHPITVFYSLLTNFSRYTPRWHQEAIAVFIETWFSGGYGRLLSNFDEMYFRSIVASGHFEEFPTHLSLDTQTSHNSFLLETTFYLYGTRFCSYLALNYGTDKLIKWFSSGNDEFYTSFISKFEEVYGLDFDQAWEDFIQNEIKFQQENIARLNKSSLTPVHRLSSETMGWTTQAFYNSSDSSFYFGYHKPHHIAGIQHYSINNNISTEIVTLPSPSIQQVASAAYDSTSNLFFYTTNNNQLYRDIWAVDTKTHDKKLLFEDCRVGDLTVSPVTHELWGVQHAAGKCALVFSAYPYKTLDPVIGFSVGDEISQLAVDPSGKFIAAALHRQNGEQSIVMVNCDSLKTESGFKYYTITASGSPEYPSWSPDSKYLFWNAYVNGVSDIYRCNLESSELKSEAISHTVSGFFKPVVISPDSIFCFEFTYEGFKPVIIPNKPAEYLPAIEYLGQRIIDKYPELSKWPVKPVSSDTFDVSLKSENQPYSGVDNLKLQTIVPVISGFQKQKVIGMLARISDPLLVHDITLEVGYSPFNENPAGPKFHFKGRYEYMKKYDFGIDHNAPDFYDLFNDRKRGMIGTKFRFGHTYYWVYDNPVKARQNTEIAVYTDVQYVNDNLVRVSEPDFFVAQTAYNLRNLRRSIGSSDFEEGYELNATAMVFGSDPNNPEYATQLFSDFSHMNTWLFPHNVLNIKGGAGYVFKNENLYQSYFFFGGFGNRALENVDFKQFRSLFRFPGVPIYTLPSEKFLKLMVENNFPPIRFSSAIIGEQYLNHIDISVYTQGLYSKFDKYEKWVDAGAQINFIFKHWFNLESTLSAGWAQAWNEHQRFNEWFVSYKLLRN
jgi:hypothetical protein